MFEEVFRKLPVMINGCYGDPLFPTQLKDTLAKLDSLKNHQGPIAIITKMKVELEVAKKISRPNLIIFYSFTGLNEGGFSFEDRKKSFENLCQVHENTVMFLRPIIPGRNDGFENIRNIIDIAKDNKKKLAYGGFKEQGTRLKILKPEVENFIQSYCDQVGVKNYPKTSCAVSAITGKDCFTHVDSEPENLLVLDFFGYKFKKNSNGKIELKTGTLGDKNFIRFLTKSQPVIINLNTNSNIISSISTKKKKYEASSSWFLWSRNISSCLECDYCVIKGLEHLKDSLSVVGCNPVDLSNLKMKVR